MSTLNPQCLLEMVLADLEELKGNHLQSLKVNDLTPLTDYMVIVTGNSSRHVRALGENLVQNMKQRQITPVKLQGDGNDEWILVDLGSVVVHIMQASVREFYHLEKLWTYTPADPILS